MREASNIRSPVSCGVTRCGDRHATGVVPRRIFAIAEDEKGTHLID